MSYQVLARKYRPRTFSELVGQEHVSKALVHALDQDRLHHAYLFTGTRGVGKTTIARILSRCLNCDQGVSSQPCGTCPTCREIDEGRFVDLIEVDAASRTKVEDTREMLDNVQYAPTRGRYKVYLIDEVHMLSAHSFNALLKTLEEPPPHVKFLLATTDPQKVPVTVLSRCLQFSLKALSAEQIAAHLQAILDQEMIRYQEPALLSLGNAAQGSIRDALSLTDQAIAFGGEQLSSEAVSTMLGTVDRNHVLALLRALVDGEPAGALKALAEIGDHCPDELALLDELISQLHQLAVCQAVPERGDATLADWAGALTSEQVQLFYDIALRGRRDIQDAPNSHAALEMLLLRMLLFTPKGVLPDQRSDASAKKPEQAPPATGGGKPDLQALLNTPATSPTSEAEPVVTQPASRAASQQAEAKQPETPANAPHTGAREPDSQPQPQPRPDESVAPAAVPPLAEPESEGEIGAWWAALLERLPLDGAVRHLARNAVLVSRQEPHWNLCISTGHQVMVNKERLDELAGALSDYFQRRIHVNVEYDQQAGDTPESLAAQERREKLAAAKQALETDPMVQELLSTFGGRLDEDSIKPKD